MKIRLIAIFALLACLLALVSFELINNTQQYARDYTATTHDAISQSMSSLYNELNNFPGGAGDDALFLSKLPEVKQLASAGSAQNTKALTQEVTDFFKEKNVYETFSFIAPDGKELFRIDQGSNGVITTPALTSAAYLGSAYFDHVLSLGANEVYISNLEPASDGSGWVMYYGTPVMDAAGNRKGVLILTVNANYFLNDIRQSSGQGKQMFLVNSDGHYLADSDTNKENLAGDSQYNFIADYPSVAPQILAGTDQGMIETASDTFTFRYVRPTLSNFEIFKAQGTLHNATTSSFYWVLVNVSSRGDVNAVVAGMEQRSWEFLGIVTALTVLIGLLLVSVIMRHRKIVRHHQHAHDAP